MVDATPRLTRRELVVAAGATLLAGAAPRARTAIHRPPGRVIVVGGGLAGLAAADALRRAGWSALVLEGRRRLGGRVLTLRTPFRAGQRAEAGAEFADRSHTVLLAYAKRFGLALEDVPFAAPAQTTVYRNGRRETLAAAETAAVRAELARYETRLAALAAHVRPTDPVGTGASLDDRTAADFLDELDLDPTARWLVEHRLRDRFAVEPDHVSLLFLCQQARLPKSLGALRFSAGADALTVALAARTDFRLGETVHRVTLTATGVQVNDHVADYCILAVPVRAWPAIHFTPELPDPLPRAAQKIQYSYGTKTLLQYEIRFWRAEGLDGGVLTDLKVTTAWEATAGQPGTPGILTAYSSGAPGFIYRSVAPSSRVLLAADELDDVFPKTRELVQASATADWFDDPFSRGIGLTYNQGQVVKYWDALRQPVGRLHFAGEHTDPLSNTMEGALRSGRRAAAAVLGR
jgi:monoamine oxidase